MSHVITCPSELTGRACGMKVRVKRNLADRKLAKSGGQVDELLGACWEETLDSGPYNFGDKGIDRGAALRSPATSKEPLEVVAGSAPGRNEPWSRVRLASVDADERSWRTRLRGTGGIPIAEADVQRARIPVAIHKAPSH